MFTFDTLTLIGVASVIIFILVLRYICKTNKCRFC